MTGFGRFTGISIMGSPGKSCNPVKDYGKNSVAVASSAPEEWHRQLQLLAYHIGVAKGYDVDKPRNLAKSVTVE